MTTKIIASYNPYIPTLCSLFLVGYRFETISIQHSFTDYMHVIYVSLIVQGLCFLFCVRVKLNQYSKRKARSKTKYKDLVTIVCVCVCVRLLKRPLRGVPQRPDALRHDQVSLHRESVCTLCRILTSLTTQTVRDTFLCIDIKDNETQTVQTHIYILVMHR